MHVIDEKEDEDGGVSIGWKGDAWILMIFVERKREIQD